MRKVALSILMVLTALMANHISAASGSVNAVKINNVGMGGHMFRLGENGLILDHTGMCMEGYIDVSADGQRGKRLVCLLEPIIDGQFMQDDIGELVGLYAFTVNSSQFRGKVKFGLPYTWFGLSMNSKVNDVKDIKMQVTLVDWANEAVIDKKVITIGKNDINIDRNSMTSNLISGFFGGGVDGDVIHTCVACDGTGLCDSCYGEGYLDPKSCRKCAASPGICRRCKGEGKEGSEINDGGGGLFDLFF